MKIKAIKNYFNFKNDGKSGLGKKGIALFFTLILSSVLLLISFSISNISFKEILLSSSGRESQVAFYASNTGIECALFYDLQGGPDGEDIFPFPPNSPTPGVSEINCGEESFPVVGQGCNEGDDCNQYNFDFSVDEGTPCGTIELKKIQRNVEGQNIIETVTESRGYNICQNGEPDTDNPRVVERALRVTYGGPAPEAEE